jgi:hypothetical protein
MYIHINPDRLNEMSRDNFKPVYHTNVLFSSEACKESHLSTHTYSNVQPNPYDKKEKGPRRLAFSLCKVGRVDLFPFVMIQFIVMFHQLVFSQTHAHIARNDGSSAATRLI